MTTTTDKVNAKTVTSSAGSSTRKRRIARLEALRNAKNKQGYEPKVPTCRDCQYCKRPQMVNRVYMRPFCGIGMFPIRMDGCCDFWTGPNGEKLA